MGQPLVYIIILNYNGYKDTIECVNSIEKITYSNYKIVIVDNASKDSSAEILKKNFDKHVIIQAESNRGFAAGNNIGIKYAIDNGAEYVLLINNDTVVEKDFLMNLVKNIDVNKKVGMLTGKIYYYAEPKRIWFAGGGINELKGNAYHVGMNEIDVGEKYSCKQQIKFASGCFQLISKELINNVGYMNEKYFMYYEDTDYCYRIINSGYKILYEPNSVIYHKVSSSTGGCKSFFTQFYMTRNRLIFINKYMNGIYKYTSLVWFYLTFFIKIFDRRQNNSACIKGISEYYKIKSTIFDNIE
ncbi:glycosyltransferase family 2 protein [Clostridium felsineum]|uniref:glycosyltransferase family 2 protein n=1 Tax=Clostridium felsineum TaxID=36839 RepID=UPI00098BE0A3|nr:glycosyltransferase family 2 protein [Clostridium felsineum]URZ14840.1 hypothetical protein CLFE_008530 [Clostridium felsineum DSM 794]